VFRDFVAFERYWKANLPTGLPPFRCPNLGVSILVCWAGYVGFKLGGMNNLFQKENNGSVKDSS